MEGIARSLQTSPQNGLQGNDLEERRQRYGRNLSAKKRQIGSIGRMFCRAFDDLLLKLIFMVSIVILCVGVAKDGPVYGFQEGVAIAIAILVIVLASVLNDYAR